MSIDVKPRRELPGWRAGRALILCATAWSAGCLHEGSQTCDNGSVCPKGQQCANIGDVRTCILLTCGNGRVDPGEACDDGNTLSGDGCPADCRPPCGDGVLDPGEVCDDGNTLDGDGCAADCRALDGISLVSPASVSFMAIEGDAPPAAVTVSVRLPSRGDSVVVGELPGVPRPSWLSIIEQPGATSFADFALHVTDTSVVGLRSTTVRLVTRDQRSTELGTFDLPVSFSLEPADISAQATPATLDFAATAGGAVPSPATVDVAFRGTSIAVQSAPSWATVSAQGSPLTSPASFTVSVNTTAFAAGTLSGDIVFAVTAGTARRTATVQVGYSVSASTPEVRFVAPYVGTAGHGGTLHVRGVGFLGRGNTATLRIGDLPIGPVLPDSDTQITVHYPPLPEGRYAVTLDPPGLALTRAELVIVTPPAMAYHAIDVSSPRDRIIYDAERQTLYGANTLDQEVDRFVYAQGNWSAPPARVIPQLTDVAMTPDGRSLIVTDRDAINEISLTDGLFAAVWRADNPFDRVCGSYLSQAAAADNGKVYLVSRPQTCSGSATSYIYDALDHSLVVPGPPLLYQSYYGTLGASADGSRIYIANGANDYIMIFESISSTTVFSNLTMNVGSINASGDASRVILQNTYVYSRSLTHLGDIPYNYGVVLASRDSSRAFVYVASAGSARLEVYDLNGALQPGALYPLLKTVMLPDTANRPGEIYDGVAMTSSLDDTVVFISGDHKLLVVPVN